MRHVCKKAALVLLLSGLCEGQSPAPAEALELYLTRSGVRQPSCSNQTFAMEIDASLPKSKARGRMTGVKLISATGQTLYRDLRYRGDNLVKTEVIARFLDNDTDPGQRDAKTALTRQNYSFVYDQTSDYNGIRAYVFRLKPKHRRVGLFKGELWLDAANGRPLRVWGDFVKSPSIVISGFRFVRDYQNVNECSQPLRLILNIETRIAGEVEMTVWMHSAEGQNGADAAARGSEMPAAEGSGR